MASETQMTTSCGGPTGGHRQAAACDGGQPDLPGGGHAELSGSGQRDYLVRLRSMVEAREYPPFCAGKGSSAITNRGAQIRLLCTRTSTGSADVHAYDRDCHAA
jgi:hypothetical protein